MYDRKGKTTFIHNAFFFIGSIKKNKKVFGKKRKRKRRNNVFAPPFHL